ncbi:MAG TPA: protein-L-isoaspartate(D-aspartate) O-methyltransferase, partial [Deltaproteobacteria bacterium]|nr:protein-L-isoaspartate(D-aspartate) O-methyltransferase [Deltaproteobacteria bacterium]
MSRFELIRKRMVEQQLSDIADARVLHAMAEVPRHSFVDEVLRPRAYDDGPLP